MIYRLNQLISAKEIGTTMSTENKPTTPQKINHGSEDRNIFFENLFPRNTSPLNNEISIEKQISTSAQKKKRLMLQYLLGFLITGATQQTCLNAKMMFP